VVDESEPNCGRPNHAARRAYNAFASGTFGQCGNSPHREFPIQIGNSDLCQAVRPFIGPSHLLFLRHAMADYLVDGRFGNAAALRRQEKLPIGV
jgi:hypothetical protein